MKVVPDIIICVYKFSCLVVHSGTTFFHELNPCLFGRLNELEVSGYEHGPLI